MESNHHEEDSSEEVDQLEQDNTDEGIGRYYECVFCKRGFTTAQALGGHMNIHRKDRAKNRPSNSVNSHKHEENYNGPRFYQPISSLPPRYYEAQEAQTMHYRTYFPASTSSARPLLYENYHHNNSNSFDQIPLRSIPFGEDWRMSLSLQFGAAHAEDHMEKKRRGRNEEDELDLELRLGHHP